MADTSPKVLNLDLFVNPSELLSDVGTIIQKVRPSWDINQVVFKVFNEGISNQLMGCFPSNGERALLVRVYGTGTELFVDRNAEQETMTALASAGLGPSLIATFNNGLVYYFVSGSILTVDSVRHPAVWPLVARRLARMHRLPAKSAPPQLWTKLDRFINLLPDDLLCHPAFTNVKTSMPEKEKLIEEVTWLRNRLENTSNPIVFCHNDLLLGNIILNDSKDDVTFIDYEYAGLSYQAYDIANHFNEYAGVDEVDYSRLPAAEYKRQWIGEYLKAYHDSTEITPRDVEQLSQDVEHFTASSHLLWALWSMVQAIHSKLDFQFSEYALIRLNEYQKTKRLIE